MSEILLKDVAHNPQVSQPRSEAKVMSNLSSHLGRLCPARILHLRMLVQCGSDIQHCLAQCIVDLFGHRLATQVLAMLLPRGAVCNEPGINHGT